MRPSRCVNESLLCEGALPLSNLLEIHLQQGSILCMSLKVSFQSSMRGGGAFTLSLVDGVVGSVSSVVLHVVLWVWVARPPGVDVTNMLIEAVGVAGESWTCTNHEGQSAALLQAPDIHSNVKM